MTEATSMLISAWYPTILGFVIYTILHSWINNETYYNLMAYDLIALSGRTAQSESQSDYKFRRTREFSKYRLFGSVGYAIAAPLVGWGIQVTNISIGLSPVEGFIGYRLLFTISGFGLLGVLGVFLVTFRKYMGSERVLLSEISQKSSQIGSIMPNTNPAGLSPVLESDNTPTEPNARDKPRTMTLLKNPEFQAIAIPEFLYVLATTVATGAIAIFFTGLGADLVYIGFRPFIWALAEVPLFFFASKLTRKHSTPTILIITYQFFTIKVFVYLFLTPDLLWVALALQVLNPWGLRLPAITNSLQDVSPSQKSLSLTLISTFNSIAGLVGGFLGAFISALAPSNATAFKWLFLASLLIMGVNLIVLLTLRRIQKHSKRMAH